VQPLLQGAFVGHFPQVDLHVVCLTLAIINCCRRSFVGVFVRVICGWMLCSLEQKQGSIASHFEQILFTDPSYIGYGIQYLNGRKYCSQKFTTTNFSSSHFLHLCTEEFSLFFVVGPGSSNCVDYHQIFILSVFSSSHRRVVGKL
jgi:hypothetical protein